MKIIKSTLKITLILYICTALCAVYVLSTSAVEPAEDEVVVELTEDEVVLKAEGLEALQKTLEELDALQQQLLEEKAKWKKERETYAAELAKLKAEVEAEVQSGKIITGSWEMVSIDDKPVTEHFLKMPTPDGKPLMEYLAERITLEFLKGQSVTELLGKEFFWDSIEAKDIQNDLIFFPNGSWFRTLMFDIKIDLGGGVSLLPKVSLAEKGSSNGSFTPTGGTIITAQEKLEIRLEPEDFWKKSSGITEEDVLKVIRPNWLFGNDENWEASLNEDTLTLTNTKGIKQVLKRKVTQADLAEDLHTKLQDMRRRLASIETAENTWRSTFKNTWGPAEKQANEKLTEALKADGWQVANPNQISPFDGNYDRSGFVRTGTDYALLFATDAYTHWPYIETPIGDAKAIGEELQDRYGFEVDIRKNVTIKQILAALAEYKEKKYDPGDQLLVYFNGHGHFDKTLQEGHIAGTESQLPDADENLTTYLSYSRLKSALNNFPCERIMVILDVDYGGTFDHNIALDKAPSTVFQAVNAMLNQPQLDLAETLKVKTRWYVSAGGKEEVLAGIEHSPFTLALLTLLENRDDPDGVLTLPELERRLPSNFKDELDQLKELYGDGEITDYTPSFGPFGSSKTTDKAFVFIQKDFAPPPTK